jgi:hypothetical protein
LIWSKQKFIKSRSFLYWPKISGSKGGRFKEEVSLTNFLSYGFFIKGLGAEILAAKD